MTIDVFMCEKCKAGGFEPSVSGDGCTFCDGTEGGQGPKFPEMTYEELSALVRKVWSDIETVGPRDIAPLVMPLRDIGLTGKTHLGKPKDWFTPRTTLEWYAGQLLSIVDAKAWFAVNSWLNCRDRFAPVQEKI